MAWDEFMAVLHMGVIEESQSDWTNLAVELALFWQIPLCPVSHKNGFVHSIRVALICHPSAWIVDCNIFNVSWTESSTCTVPEPVQVIYTFIVMIGSGIYNAWEFSRDPWGDVLILWSHAFVTHAERGLALSEISRDEAWKILHLDGSICCFKIFMNLLVLMVSSQLCTIPVTHPHSIMDLNFAKSFEKDLQINASVFYVHFTQHLNFLGIRVVECLCIIFQISCLLNDLNKKGGPRSGPLEGAL